MIEGGQGGAGTLVGKWEWMGKINDEWFNYDQLVSELDMKGRGIKFFSLGRGGKVETNWVLRT